MRTYIFSDDPQFCQRLQNHQETHHKVLQAFAHGVKEFRGTGTHLLARLEKSVSSPPEADIDIILDALDALKKIVQVLPSSTQGLALKQGALHIFRRLPVFLMVSAFATLMLNLLLGFQIIEFSSMLAMAWHYTLLYLIAALIVLWASLRHTSYGHEALMRFALLSSWSGALLIFMALCFTNCYYDHSEPQVHTQPILEKYLTHGRKSKHYHVRVADWTGHKNTLSVQVNLSLYNALKEADNVRILSHPGLWGVEWIAKLEPVP